MNQNNICYLQCSAVGVGSDLEYSVCLCFQPEPPPAKQSKAKPALSARANRGKSRVLRFYLFMGRAGRGKSLFD